MMQKNGGPTRKFHQLSQRSLPIFVQSMMHSEFGIMSAAGIRRFIRSRAIAKLQPDIEA
jgi:hypothetical protein